jgi:nickel/cobalt transporter (NicO) family protein
MDRRPVFLLPLLWTAAASGHPMGNFSINHYARLDLAPDRCTLTYVLDFAEIPTFELLQQWNVDAKNSAALSTQARMEARKWVSQLSIAEGARAVRPELETVRAAVQDGAGGMPILRVVMLAKIPAGAGTVHYQDRNYAERTGWKEIVVRQHRGVQILKTSSGDKDLSKELTSYPLDASVLPPQDLQAFVEWKPVAPPVLHVIPPATAVIRPVQAPEPSTPPTVKAFAAQQPIAAGTVVKGDFLSKLLRRSDIGLGLILIGIAVAFGLGAIHALSPGHGKTIVAAYLVGSRGTAKHAMFLGATVTVTHTASVFLLGLGVLFFEQYIVPERIIPWLGAASGLSIVAVGAWLLYQRSKSLLPGESIHHHAHAHGDHHHHHHSHAHAHTHSHDHDHEHVHTEGHAHEHVHSHGGRPHSHLPPEKITMGSLIALGVSGGLVPCPSALVLMLSAIALGHAGLGLFLLLGFSLGLAIVLMAIGVAVISAKRLIPDRPAITAHPFFRLVPVFSALVVVCIGLGMTAVSLGWTRL